MYPGGRGWQRSRMATSHTCCPPGREPGKEAGPHTTDPGAGRAALCSVCEVKTVLGNLTCVWKNTVSPPKHCVAKRLLLKR